jgi:hypothetical protein
MAFYKFPKVSESTLSQITGEEYEGNILSTLRFENGHKIERRYYVHFDEVARQYFEYKKAKEIQETKAGLEAIQNMYEPEGEPSYAYFNNEKIEIKGGFSMPEKIVIKDDAVNALSYSLQAFGPATTEGTKKPVADPLKEINNIITDTFKNPLIQAKKDAEKYEKKFNKVVEQARIWKGQYNELEINFNNIWERLNEKNEEIGQQKINKKALEAANRVLSNAVEEAAKLNSDMKVKLERVEERLATELAKNFDLNFKSAIERIKQQKDELKKRGKEIVELKESLEKLAIEEEKLEERFGNEHAVLLEKNEKLRNYITNLEKENKSLARIKNRLQNQVEEKDLLIESYEARKKADLESIKNLQAQNDRREAAILNQRHEIKSLKKEIEKLENGHDCEEHQVIEWEDGRPVKIKCDECKLVLWREK